MNGHAMSQCIFSTYEKLGSKEKRTLHGVACYYILGTSFGEPLDLLHEALLRSAVGSRNWRREMDFSVHIMLAMRSIADGDRKRHSNKCASNIDFDELLEWGMPDMNAHPSAEEECSREQDEVAAKSVISKARTCWAAVGDQAALDTLDGMLMEMSNAKIGEAFGLAALEVRAAKKRVLRKLGTLARI